jgi:hypothetical protein
MDRAIADGAAYPVIDGGPRQHSVGRLPDQHRG